MHLSWKYKWETVDFLQSFTASWYFSWETSTHSAALTCGNLCVLDADSLYCEASFETWHFLVTVVVVTNRAAAAALQAAGLWLWHGAPVLTLWLQGFGAFLWCCQQRYQRCWACGCCKDWSTFPLIYLVTPPSSGGVYELTGEKKQPICKQQNNKPVLQFLLLMFGFFYLLVMSFLVHLQFQVLRYVMMLLIFTWVWILY